MYNSTRTSYLKVSIVCFNQQRRRQVGLPYSICAQAAIYCILYAIVSVSCTVPYFLFIFLLYYYTWPTSHYYYCLSFAIILVCHQTEKGMGRCELALTRYNIPVAQDAATTCSHSIIANQDSLCNGHIMGSHVMGIISWEVMA